MPDKAFDEYNKWLDNILEQIRYDILCMGDQDIRVIARLIHAMRLKDYPLESL